MLGRETLSFRKVLDWSLSWVQSQPSTMTALSEWSEHRPFGLALGEGQCVSAENITRLCPTSRTVGRSCR